MKKFPNHFLKIPKHIKASFVILLSSFVNSAMNFITIPIFTRLMTVAEFGLTAQYNSWLSIITVFATLSLSAGVYQVAMNEYENDRDGFTFSVMVLSNICTCLVFGIILSFGKFFSELFHINQSLLLMMFLYLLFYPAMSMWLARQRYEYQYIKVAIVSIGSAVLSQIVALTCVCFMKYNNSGEVKIYATQGTMIVFSLGIAIYIAYKAHWKINIEYIKFAFLFNLPLLAHYLAQYVLRSSDKIMITNFIGDEATGIYSLATTVANISMLAWSAMSASLTPYVYHRLNIKDYKSIQKTVVLVEIIFSICCIIIALIGPEIIFILGSQKFRNGVDLIPPIAASSLLSAVYSFYSTIAFYYHKTFSTAVMTVIAAVLNICLNFYFIPRYGFIAAAYTTETAYLIYTILHFINYKKIVGQEKIYNDLAILGIAILTTFFCLAAGFLYQHFEIRYILIAVFISGCLLLRNKISMIFNSLIGGE